MTRADLAKDPHEVAAMFDELAGQYDLLNDVLSVGQDRLWRRTVVKAIDAKPGELVLDLAAGTGASSVPFVRAGAHVVPCDFSVGMLRAGIATRPRLPFVAGDALRLPFGDGSFDVATMSFGLRNLSDTRAGLAEMARVTKAGGRLVICEFSTATWEPFRKVYDQYLQRVLSPVAVRLSSNPPAYAYLAESIRAWPDQAALAAIIASAGWDEVAWRNLTGGVVALHRARKPLAGRR